MMNVLITGASGFVGGNLKTYLGVHQHYQIQTLSLRGPAVTTVDAGVDVIIHLAGKAHDLKNGIDEKEYFNVNYELTKKLYDAFLASNAYQFIFMSSIKALADNPDRALTEEDIPNPITAYGKSKLMAEEYIRKQQMPEGKQYIILRPCMIHGPGNKGNLNLLYKLVKSGLPYPLAAFENKRSLLSIDNLCFFINELLERKDIASGTFNLADDEPLSTNEIITILATSVNRKPFLVKIPKAIIITVAKVGDMLKLPLTTERLQKLTENYIVNNTKIKETLDVQLPFTVQEGLSLTAKSFK